jgi:uncharacterized protein involved in type VI secretion and phage assembly
MADPSMEKTLIDAVDFIRTRFFGKYRGLVTNVDDPENLGRIQAKVPEIYQDTVSPWALPCVPFAGSDHGFLVLPEVGDGVWFEFEGGNPSHPIWTGFWWGNGEIPQPGSKDVRVLINSSGQKIIMDEQNNKIQILHPSGGEFTITDTDITIKTGSSKIVLSASGVSINDGAFEVR